MGDLKVFIFILKNVKKCPPKKNIALFLYSSTMTVSPPKVIIFFFFLRDHFVLEHEKLAPYFSCTEPSFCKAITGSTALILRVLYEQPFIYGLTIDRAISIS